eukprot:TRINITY_DN75594_c0_g1_i1.p1 TRINITY_DN75594_c0_g1~~TRINITY_DN75594_c0_g1_i1.p1  ORF type:complete len:220 (-),score=1.93 TRINITY_DN75594_c0_g1_i1:26-685(-)
MRTSMRCLTRVIGRRLFKFGDDSNPTYKTGLVCVDANAGPQMIRKAFVPDLDGATLHKELPCVSGRGPNAQHGKGRANFSVDFDGFWVPAVDCGIYDSLPSAPLGEVHKTMEVRAPFGKIHVTSVGGLGNQTTSLEPNTHQDLSQTLVETPKYLVDEEVPLGVEVDFVISAQFLQQRSFDVLWLKHQVKRCHNWKEHTWNSALVEASQEEVGQAKGGLG